ncbi:MAG: thiol-activated cytolysin family protein [Bacteroidota bacterium]
MKNLRLSLLAGVFILISVLAFFACEGEVPPGPVGDNVNDYLSGLPSWSEFSPPRADMDPAPTGENPSDEQEEILDVAEYQEDGSVDTLFGVSYKCKSIPYSITNNPNQIVMYSPDREILYPGALIQGKSHAEPLGSLLGLRIRERTPIKVAIPDFATSDNFRLVEVVENADVSAAVGEIIGNATQNNLSAPSSISFKEESYNSESEFGLKVGISGKYLGYSASATGSINRNSSETTVTAQFFQRMFEVVVEPPQTPGGFFSSDFTSDKLQEQVNLGRMGPDNLPVYVSKVTYGRMMMFSMTSTASEEDIRATLKAGYEGISGNVKANMSLKQQKILETSKITIASLGGDAKATLDMIKSGNWKDYFTNEAPLSSASPLSYTFRNLGDGSIAKVTETTKYSIKECSAVQTSPGVFEFNPEMSFSIGDISFPVETHKGDFDGDGDTDILFNHKSNNSNQVKVGLSDGNGGFSFLSVSNQSETAPDGDWQNYTTLIGDFNGDGKIDIAWNSLKTSNKNFIALAQGDGTFEYQPIEEFGSVWPTYDALVGDIDNDGKDEFVYNNTTGSANGLHSADYDGPGMELNNYRNIGRSGDAWGGYTAFLADVDGGGEDMIFSTIPLANSHYIYTSSFVNGNWTSRKVTSRGNNGWRPYKIFIGNIDGNSNTDLVFNALEDKRNVIHKDLAKGDGTFSLPGYQDHPLADNEDWRKFEANLVDVNNDGKSDMVWSINGTGETVNRVYVALATDSGDFDFSPEMQTHPANVVWSQYKSFPMDLNGDGKMDLLWVDDGGTVSMFAAIAR